MSRYYSQSYAPLDDPERNPSVSPGPSARNSSDNLHAPNSSYEPYHSQTQLPSYADDAPLTNTQYVSQPLPSAYIDSKYPQPGFTGLAKSKGHGIVGWWRDASLRKKLIVVGSAIAAVILIALAISVTVVETEGSSFSFTPSTARVTNEAAFQSGAGSREVPPKNHDGIGAGEDVYQYYQGGAANFPTSDKWVSFQQMWSNNLPTMQGSCSTLGDGDDDTAQQINFIGDAIKNISTVSKVDHRFVLAIILQESQGCVHVGQTKSSSGVTNPGLMQSHDGHSFDSSAEQLSILAMVQDGTQGTQNGAGLVQGLNKYGNLFEAARYYNSGVVGADLSQTDSGTPCYVSDVANRLTGWTTAKNECPDNGV